MNEDNKGYLLEISNDSNGQKVEKIFLNPKKLYIPDIAVEEITFLIKELESIDIIGNSSLTVSMTNNNNGVSVDKNISSVSELSEPLNLAQIIKDLINIIRGYDIDEESNVCGW